MKTHLTIEHLCREGNLEWPQDQAQDIPEAVLRNIKKAVQEALLQTLLQTPDDATHTLNFSDVRQGIEESFIKFIDCLKSSIERQVENAEARKETLHSLAVANSNAEYKKI